MVALGYLAGLFVAAPPVGPLTLLFYRHAMVRDFRAAAALAVVIALADGAWTALSAFGLAWIATAPPNLVLVARLAGVALIAALGVRYALFTPKFELQIGEGSSARVTKVAAQALGIAALNPSAIVSWIVIVDVLRTAAGTFGPGDPSHLALLPIAVTSGVATWFLFVLAVLRSWLQPPPPRLARAVVRVVGWVLISTAAVYGWQSVRPGGLGALVQEASAAPIAR